MLPGILSGFTAHTAQKARQRAASKQRAASTEQGSLQQDHNTTARLEPGSFKSKSKPNSRQSAIEKTAVSMALKLAEVFQMPLLTTHSNHFTSWLLKLQIAGTNHGTVTLIQPAVGHFINRRHVSWHTADTAAMLRCCSGDSCSRLIFQC